MRLILLAVLCLIVGVGASKATTTAPTGLTVTLMHDSAGQFFRVAFTKMATPTDSTDTSYYYVVYRYKGTSPSITNKTRLGYVYQGPLNNSYYDDKGYQLQYLPTDTAYSSTWSYYVYTVHIISSPSNGTVRDSSGATSLVVGTLDPVYLHFTQTIDTLSKKVTVGQVVSGTFTAVRSTTGATITYAITSNSGPAIASIDANTGVFSASLSSAQSSSTTSRIVVQAFDETGRTVIANVFLINTVATVYDNLTVNLQDASGTALPNNTKCYYGWGAIYGTDSALTTIAMKCNSGGQLVISNGQATKRRLRVTAEGYDAQWVLNGSGDDTLTSNGTYTRKLNAATKYTMSGKATTISAANLAGAKIYGVRIYGTNKGLQYLDTATTASDGTYSMLVSVGDVLLGTTKMYMRGKASGFTDSLQWYDHTTVDSMRAKITVTSNQSGIDFNFLTPNPTPPTGTNGCIASAIVQNGPKDTIKISANLQIYKLSGGVFTLYRTDVTTIGYWCSELPYGSYLLYAVPSGGYNSGYYHKGSFVASAALADTFVLSSRYNYALIYITHPIAHDPGSGGSPIAGFVRDSSGPVIGVHVLLYQVQASPAGLETGKTLFETGLTDSLGQYSFNKVPTGMYEIVIDRVGEEPINVEGIVVDTTGQMVNKDISLGVTRVSSAALSPSGLSLSQNYPNPFGSTTTLAFSTSEERAMVDVSIYDITGRCVANLVHQTMPQGDYRVELNQELRPGVYTCVLKSGASMTSRMITVLK